VLADSSPSQPTQTRLVMNKIILPNRFDPAAGRKMPGQQSKRSFAFFQTPTPRHRRNDMSLFIKIFEKNAGNERVLVPAQEQIHGSRFSIAKRFRTQAF
jgi:hypothetical protein